MASTDKAKIDEVSEISTPETFLQMTSLELTLNAVYFPSACFEFLIHTYFNCKRRSFKQCYPDMNSVDNQLEIPILILLILQYLVTIQEHN